MKQRVSEEQLMRILKDADRGETTIGEGCRAPGISENTFDRWRRQYAGRSIPEVRRLHARAKEHARLKRMMAERALGIDALKALLAKQFCALRTAARRWNSCSSANWRSDAPARWWGSAGQVFPTSHVRRTTAPWRRRRHRPEA